MRLPHRLDVAASSGSSTVLDALRCRMAEARVQPDVLVPGLARAHSGLT